MPIPFEVIAAPVVVYSAPVGEAFPAIEDAPVGNWTLIGLAGDRGITEEGVKLSHPQTTEVVRSLGSTAPIKVFRTEEDLMIEFEVMDLTLENYKLIVNSNVVATTAAGGGAAGFKEVDLYRGADVSQFAILIRGDFSPYGDNWNTQWEIPVMFQTGSPEIVFVKGTPVGLAFEFTAIGDPNAATPANRFGRTVAQNAAPV